MTYREVIEFITRHIIHRFGIPQTLTTDQETSFISKEVHEFVDSYGIKLLNSSTYYSQVNGQAESSNKSLVTILEDGMRHYLKLYGLIIFQDMVLLKLLLLSLSMVKKTFCPLR
jgi:transposase InsO family protein